jgi:hypothetical protein
MSVTFYDPNNKSIYDDDYNLVGGGEEVNFSNSNAYMVLRMMGVAVTDGLFGEMDGAAFRKRVLIGLSTVSNDVFRNKDEHDVERRLNLLLSTFEISKLVCWG